jgi:predicted phosphoadenosine phosphosulfate sulfurtransferase
MPDNTLSPSKRGLGIDVLTAARRRLARVFNDFPNVYISFSGGKDSGVLLELAACEARARGRTLGVLIIDLEAQYEHTIDYIRTMLDRHADVLEVYWVALPMSLRNAVSQFQPQWMCWDPDARDSWVRPLPDHPGVISDPRYFPFFHTGMEFEDFIVRFGEWYSDQHDGRMTACLVGIRSDESLNRFRTIASRRKRRHADLAWTTWIEGSMVWNAYPIYDWRTEDIWRFYGKTKAPYNKVYDLMHRAGVSIHAARLCQPYGDDQKRGLWLYHIIEPRTWGRVVARVQGANFGARYARETGNIMGRVKIECPKGMTWREYAMSLLASMPPATADAYKDRIAWFIHWHSVNTPGCEGGQIPDDGPLDRKHPSWRRICKVILTYDYWCKGLTFSPPAHREAYRKYKKTMAARRREWGFDGLQ